MAEIQLRNVSKRWGSFVGVENFSLTVADREFLVLLGPDRKSVVEGKRVDVGGRRIIKKKKTTTY